MAKEPRPGFAKTRLCPPCTPGQAAELAEASLRDTLAAAAATPAAGLLVALAGRPEPWLAPGLDVFEHVSIRRIRPGRHTIDLQINGRVLASTSMDIVDPDGQT